MDPMDLIITRKPLADDKEELESFLLKESRQVESSLVDEFLRDDTSDFKQLIWDSLSELCGVFWYRHAEDPESSGWVWKWIGLRSDSVRLQEDIRFLFSRRLPPLAVDQLFESTK